MKPPVHTDGEVTQADRRETIRHARAYLTAELGRKPTLKELATELFLAHGLRVTKDEIRQARNHA